MNDAPNERVDYFGLGLKDAVLSGWFDAASGELVPGFKVEAEDVVVDVGCGDGGIASFCARLGAHVILADIDAERLGRAMARLQSIPARRLDGHVTNGIPLPLKSNSASRLICTEVLEHVDDPQAFMAELSRVGRPGALYLLTVPGAVHENIQRTLAPSYYFKKPHHVRIFESHEFEALVEGAGLVIERRSVYGFYWSIWWILFWQTDTPPGGSHPSLDAWASTWDLMLQGRDGARIKRALDDLMPKSQTIVARKPL